MSFDGITTTSTTTPLGGGGEIVDYYHTLNISGAYQHQPIMDSAWYYRRMQPTWTSGPPSRSLFPSEPLRAPDASVVSYPSGSPAAWWSPSQLITPPSLSGDGWDGTTLVQHRLHILAPTIVNPFDDYGTDIVFDLGGALSVLPSWALVSGDNHYWNPRTRELATSGTNWPFMAIRSTDRRLVGSHGRKMKVIKGYGYGGVYLLQDQSDGALYALYDSGVSPLSAPANLRVAIYSTISGTPHDSTLTVTAKATFADGSESVFQTWTDTFLRASDHTHYLMKDYTVTNAVPAGAWQVTMNASRSVEYWSDTFNQVQMTYNPPMMPGCTSDHVTGGRVPCGGLVKVADAII